MSRLARRRLTHRLFVGLSALATISVVAALGLIGGLLVVRGLPGLDLALLTLDQPPPGTPGGLRNAIAGSAIMVALALAGALAVGIPAGTWIAEYGAGTRRAAVAGLVNDVLLSAPSITVGLFVYAALVVPLAGFSGLAGAAALALLATPMVVRATAEALRLQPPLLRDAGLALGARRGAVVRRLLWRAGRGGIVAAALLALARIAGETAPLLFTALGDPFLQLDPRAPMAALPVLLYQFAQSPYPDWVRLARAGALLLVLAVLAVTLVVRLLLPERRP